MRGHTPNGAQPGPPTPSLAGLDAGRQALLCELLAELVQHQDPEAVWAVLATRLKWLLDIERCAVAVLNPNHQTYQLRTVFEARPAGPPLTVAPVPVDVGLVGVLLQRGTPYVLLDLARDPLAPRVLADPWVAAGAVASVLSVRLHVQGQTMGALHLGRVRAGGYAAADLAIAGQVAAQLSVVLAGWALRDAQSTTATALHQSEALNRQLLESSGDAISILDLTGHLLLLNPSGQRAWELNDRPLARDTSWVAFWAEAPQAVAAVAAAARGDPGHFEGQYRSGRTGTRTWWDVLVTPILDSHGHPDRLLAIARDITGRKAAEQALHESETRFRMLADSAPVLIWATDATGACQFVNQPYLTYTGDTLASAHGQGWRRALHPEDVLAYRHAWHTAHAQHMAFGAVVRLRRADGVYRWFQTVGTPRCLPDGTFLGLVGCGLDITPQQEATQALQQAHDLLEQRVQERTAALQQEILERQRLERDAQRAAHFAMLGRLAAGLSHEIRNPLGAVFLHVDVLTEELQQPSPDSPTQLAEALTEIKTQLARLDELVQDYLSLVRIGGMERTVQDLGTAVAAWSAEMQPTLTERRGRLQTQGLASLGHAAFHASTLRRVVVNLVQNAIDALPPGGTVTLAGHGTATHVQLVVQDTGSGIAAEQLEQIFEPLYTTKPGGTGLGLYIAQQIVAAHEGQLTVHSVVGQGTVVTITLPRQAAPSDPGEPEVR
jgi:PAS domain S-box-containing protein